MVVNEGVEDMAHVEPYKMSAVAPMVGHYNREAERERGYERENIDLSRTHLNYAVTETEAPKLFIEPDLLGLSNVRGNEALARAVKARIAEAVADHEKAAKRAVRKDANVMMDWVITAPEDLPKDREQDFFRAFLGFLRDRYGAENVPGVFVHLDEHRPHGHAPLIPVLDGRLRASQMVDRADLRTFHDDLQRHMDATLGIHVSVLLGDEQQGEKQLSRLSQSEYQAAKDKLREQQVEIDRRAEEIAQAEAKKVAKQGEINELDGKIAKKRSEAADLAENIAEKTGQVDGLKAQIAQFSARKTAAEGEVAKVEKAQKDAEEALRRAEEAQKEAERGQQVAEAAQKDVTDRLERLRGRERAAEGEVAALRARIALAEDAPALRERIRGLRGHCRALVARIAATRPARAVMERVAVICRSINLPHPLVTEEEESFVVAEEEAFVVARPTRRQETQVRREPKVRPQERQRALSPEEMRAAATREAARQSGVFNHGNGGNVVRGWGR